MVTTKNRWGKLACMFAVVAMAAFALTAALPSTAHALLHDKYTVTGIGADRSDSYVFEVIKEPPLGYDGDREVSLISFTDNGEPTTEVTIPSSILGSYAVTEIGAAAFEEDRNLQSVTIPDSVTLISDGAFSKCYNATSLNLGNGVQAIGMEAFYGFGILADSAGTLTLPNSLTTIYQNAFYTSNFKGALVLPDSLENMGQGVFAGCEGFTSVTFGSGLTTIPSRTFEQCLGLAGNLVIPSTVTTIGAYAFRMLPNEESRITGVTLPATLTSIGAEAFKDCTSLASVTIPKSVTTFGKGAFTGCTALANLTLEGGLTVIGEEAFKGCTGLTALAIPASVTSFGKYAFADCTWLSNLTFADGLKRIGVLAFNGCVRLLSVAIPDSVTTIDTRAFDSCTNLATVTFGGGLKIIGTGAFQNCSGLQAANMPDSVTTLGTHAFNNCYNLSTLRIGKGVKSIGTATFQKCYLLSSLTIPDGVTSIGNYAFFNCSGIANAVKIPDSVTSIGDYAFQKCPRVPSFTFGSGLKTIGTGAFYGCTAMTSLTLPAGITTIGAGAFNECPNLAGTLTLPASLTSVGNIAFGDRRFAKVVNNSTTAFAQTRFLSTATESGYFYADASGVRVESLGKGTYTLANSFKQSIAGATITGVAAKTFTGKALTQNPTVELGGKTLANGTDYELTYKNNVNAGTATMTVTGKGSYTGALSATFTIKKAAIALKLSKTSSAYTGSAVSPAVTVTGPKGGKAGQALKKGTDYTLAVPGGRKNAGTYTYTVKGAGNYTGTMTAKLTITKAANSAKAAKTSVPVSLKASALAKGAKTVALPKVTTKFGTAKWKVSTPDKKKVLGLSGTKVKVKKGAKAGTYIMKLKATVAGAKNYKAAATKVVTVKVTVTGAAAKAPSSTSLKAAAL